MEFIKEGATLPIPMNIIPTPAFIYESIKKLFFCFKNSNNSDDNNNDFNMGRATNFKGKNAENITYKVINNDFIKCLTFI
jgi:hypothetical protein